MPPSWPGCWRGSATRRCTCSNGGYFKWQLEQRPSPGSIPRIAAIGFPSGPFPPGARVTGRGAARGRPADAVLVDARPPDQYAGQAGAQMRRGHIPGAINHYWQDDLTRRASGTSGRSPANCGRIRGAGHHARTRHHRLLQQHHRGEPHPLHPALLLGYPRVRVYVGSWTEWAEREELPIAAGQRAQRGQRGSSTPLVWSIRRIPLRS